MARRPRASRLETRTTRLKLPIRWKPYDFTTISPGIALGYRRNQSAGVWVVRVADGRGGNWTKRVALADDFEAADGAHVLTWWQAIEAARKLARGSTDDGRPATVAEAVNAYERDLIARGGDTANAKRIRKHLTPTLAAKPVAVLSSRELAAWRDSLLAADTLERSSVLRLLKSTKAALNLAARRDHRITNAKAWSDGLSGIEGAVGTRNASALSDDQVRDVIAAAAAIDAAFGLYIEVAAVTGARLSQITRLTVADLQNGREPRLLMPSSRKGRGKRAITKRPVPITKALAAKLKSNRAADAPLLLRSDGLHWQATDKGDHLKLFAQALAACGLQTGSDGKKVTAYSLRHSSIIRSLVASVPTRVVAALHDTSVAMLEKHYSGFILDHADTIARRGLLDARP
jgi:integrase